MFSKKQLAVAKDHLKQRIQKAPSQTITVTPRVVTITISGQPGTGKSYLKYAIAKMITKKLGLKVDIEELDMSSEALTKFKSKKKEIKQALKNSDIVYKIMDIHTKHPLPQV